jgi:hypothetical protein
MVKARSNGKPPNQTRIDELVGHYIAVRDELEDRKKAYKADTKPLNDMMDELTRHLLSALDDSGAESARTDMGTVTATVRYSIKAEDPDALMKYIEKTGFVYLLDRRPNITACREFAEENDTLPPGVKLNSMRTVSVRSPS